MKHEEAMSIYNSSKLAKYLAPPKKPAAVVKLPSLAPLAPLASVTSVPPVASIATSQQKGGKNRRVKIIKQEVDIDGKVYTDLVRIPLESKYERCMRKLQKKKL